MLKKILVKTLLIFFIFNISIAEVIKDIKISGNDRISKETVILFSGLNVGKKVNDNDLNESLKKLYNTSFFKSISISIEKNTLFIDLKENPLIQTIVIEGIKKKSSPYFKFFLVTTEP